MIRSWVGNKCSIIAAADMPMQYTSDIVHPLVINRSLPRNPAESIVLSLLLVI